MTDPSDDATVLLSAISSGDLKSWKKLISLVYRELHAMAHEALRSERSGHTLQTTALVHEAYLRLVQNRNIQWHDRGHFFRAAAKAMRRILVDHARNRKALKRGAGRPAISIDELVLQSSSTESSQEPFDDLEALDRALSKLELQESNRRRCTVVELLFFVGMNFEQASKVLEVSPTTVSRDWVFTRAWLRREIIGGEACGAE